MEPPSSQIITRIFAVADSAIDRLSVSSEIRYREREQEPQSALSLDQFIAALTDGTLRFSDVAEVLYHGACSDLDSYTTARQFFALRVMDGLRRLIARSGKRKNKLSMPEHAAQPIHYVLCWGAACFDADSSERAELLRFSFDLTDRDGFGARDALAGSYLARGKFEKAIAFHKVCKRRDMLTPAIEFARVIAEIAMGFGATGLAGFVELAAKYPFAAEYLLMDSRHHVRHPYGSGAMGSSWQEVAGLADDARGVLSRAHVHYALASTHKEIAAACDAYVLQLARVQRPHSTPEQSMEYLAKMAFPSRDGITTRIPLLVRSAVGIGA
jgi:hypothetical protein